MVQVFELSVHRFHLEGHVPTVLLSLLYVCSATTILNKMHDVCDCIMIRSNFYLILCALPLTPCSSIAILTLLAG